jgi:integrase
LEDLRDAQNDLSGKTVRNMFSALHSFYQWLRKRKIISLQEMPEFPDTSQYVMGYRNLISKDQQLAVLDEVYRLSYKINPKIWLGIKFLSTYFSIRPGEMIRLKEKQINLMVGRFIIPDPKEKKYKSVPILAEDIELLKQFPRGLPDLPFFRHVKGISGTREGKPFGEKYFYKWWKRACSNLGIQEVDLYGGTKHSTVTALENNGWLYDEIKTASGISTNEAFDRYFRTSGKKTRDIYHDAVPGRKIGKQLGNNFEGPK